MPRLIPRAAVIVLLACVTLLGVAYASGKTDSIDKARRTLSVGFALAGSETVWKTSTERSIRDSFTDEGGYRLFLNDSGSSPERQIEAVRAFVAQGVDYVVANPIGETGWEEALAEARLAGIPVLLIDRMIKLTDQGLYTAWIGPNYLKQGQDAVKWLAAYAKKKGQDARDLSVVIVQGTIGSSAQVGRTQGVSEGLAKNPRFKLLAKQSADFSRVKAEEVTRSFLRSYPRIDVLFAESDAMAFGAIDAIREAGLRPGADVAILSLEATKEGLSLVAQGEIACDVETQPLYGPLLSELIALLDAGRPVTKISYLPEATLDSESVPKRLQKKE